ncbi:MAG TPA: DUF2064 domain-containing protein [Jatrophihabitans sp.]|nr:DUF2064 domain-containing protein [Jatrophihabitans sp.]
MTTVIVLATDPVPGRAKTRLVPPLSYPQAATLAAAALSDTLRAVDASAALDRVLAFEGAVARWLRPGWRAVSQPAGGLDERLIAAFAAIPYGPAVLVGMDTPQLRPEQLDVFDPRRYDACLGLATDGGYWAIGFADPTVAAATIRGVPMSTTTTGAAQLRRLVARGLRIQLLDDLTDVDTIDTADRVAWQAPDTAFAATLRETKRRAS